MVNLHFLSLMEALAECKSTVLSLLMPLWTPVLQAQNPQVRTNRIGEYVKTFYIFFLSLSSGSITSTFASSFADLCRRCLWIDNDKYRGKS